MIEIYHVCVTGMCVCMTYMHLSVQMWVYVCVGEKWCSEASIETLNNREHVEVETAQT